MRPVQKGIRGGILVALTSTLVLHYGTDLGLSEIELAGVLAVATAAVGTAYRLVRDRWTWLQAFDPILIGDEAAKLASIRISLAFQDGTEQSVEFGPGVERMSIPVEAGHRIARLDIAPTGAAATTQ